MVGNCFKCGVGIPILTWTGDPRLGSIARIDGAEVGKKFRFVLTEGTFVGF